MELHSCLLYPTIFDRATKHSPDLTNHYFLLWTKRILSINYELLKLKHPHFYRIGSNKYNQGLKYFEN